VPRFRLLGHLNSPRPTTPPDPLVPLPLYPLLPWSYSPSPSFPDVFFFFFFFLGVFFFGLVFFCVVLNYVGNPLLALQQDFDLRIPFFCLVWRMVCGMRGQQGAEIFFLVLFCFPFPFSTLRLCPKNLAAEGANSV